ncbi:NTP transferase domain-containing protein [candidate division WOR-3 bacterium]|jgi:glucose-1-phosphate thymidylyltransferase|nr:NTP transferase domain-containing protein [candidate division WOR-3 bacterium]
MKVIIPAAGRGTRLQPHTFSIPKPLIRFAGKSMLEHIIDNIEKAKISEYIFIVGYLKEAFVKYFDGNINGTKLSYVDQLEQKGLADAIYKAKGLFKKDEEVLIILGDTLFEADIVKQIKKDESFICVHKVDNPDKFGVVYIDEDEYITDLIEKPKESKSDLAVVGIYYFNSAFSLFRSIDFILNNNIKTAGEFQITDALNYFVKTGGKLRAVTIDKWYDCGNREKLIETQRLYIKRYNKHMLYNNSSIIEPVYIDESAIVENSIIGPYVSIDKNAFIKNSIISDTIIGISSHLENANIKSSVVGDESRYINIPESIDLGSKSEITKGGIE